MKIDQIATEAEALDQLKADAQESMKSTLDLLYDLELKEATWLDEFQQLSKEAQATDMNHYKLNYLIGLSILIPILDTFRKELKDHQTVYTPVEQQHLGGNEWGSNDEEIDDWLKH